MAFSGRFRLRAAMLIIAVLAALTAWPAAQWRKWSREQAFVRRLEAKDAQVRIQQRGTLPFGGRVVQITVDEYVRLRPQSGSPDEARPENLRLTVDDIRQMAKFDMLVALNLHGDVLEPAAYAAIGELKQLKSLRVSQGLWDDERLRHLESLEALEDLTLEQTEATDDGIAWLQKKLPKLAIVDD
jgi:hypothetical protein